MSAHPWGEANEAEWRALDEGGWEYLLPDGRNARWLCVDVLSGGTMTFLARICGELHVVPARPDDAPAIEARIALLGFGNVRVHPTGWPAAASDGLPFDGFVLHDLRGAIGEPDLSRWLDAARTAVGPDGFLYVSGRNRDAYTRLRSGESASCHRSRPGSILRRLGRADAIVHPFICDGNGRLLDVIAPSGYVSAKNPTRTGERFRQFVLGPATARRFSPSFGIVARGPRTPPPLFEAVVREAEARGLLAAGATFRRYHVLHGGKVIVSLGAPGRGFGRVIVVFARGALAIARREREFAMLARLRALPEPIARCVPQPYFRSDAAGTPAYLMEELPGVTLDAPVPLLEAATREGVAFLERLHLATLKPIDFDGAVFERICDPMLRTAGERYPALAEPLARIREPMRESLVGTRLPLVWMHGDFKVENIIVDPRTGALVGVIDWEHAEPEGLPFIDLWYLLLYNEAIRTGVHFFPAVRMLTTPGRLPLAMSRACDAYASALGIPSRARHGLLAAFIVHHIARRLIYDPREDWRMRLIATSLEELMEWKDRD